MDARAPQFLDGHEPAPFDATVDGNRMEAVCSGVVRGPAVRCTYLARIGCGDDLVVDPEERYRVQLEMYVPELAGLDFELDRELDSDLAHLWIDDAIAEAAERLDEDDWLAIRDGLCTLNARVTANSTTRMPTLVAVMIAIAAAPERRMRELADALAGEELRAPGRLAIDGHGLVVSRRGVDIEIGVANGKALDGSGLRTRVRASHARDAIEDGLVVVDTAVPRGERPRNRLARWGRDWLTEGAVPDLVKTLLDAARPRAVVMHPQEVIVSFTELVTEPDRLRAALDCIEQLAAPHAAAPYR